MLLNANKVFVALLVSFAPHFVLAQTIVINSYDSTGVVDSLKRIGEVKLPAKDVVKVKEILPKEAHEIDSIKQGLISKKIFSERKLRALNDSLRQLGLPGDLANYKNADIKEQEYLQQIKSTYGIKDQSGLLTPLNSFESLQSPSLSEGLPTLPSDRNLSNIHLPEIKNLPALPTNLVNPQYAKTADSLRKIDLRQDRLRLQERKLSPTQKLSTLKAIPRLPERLYWEALVGMYSAQSTDIYQLAPSLGIHLSDYFSVGAGPSLKFALHNKELRTDVGFRTFIKGEFLERQIYVQLEDGMNSYPTKEDALKNRSHTVLFGGGALLSLKHAFTLNVSVMCRVDQMDQFKDLSPFVVRLGISSVKRR